MITKDEITMYICSYALFLKEMLMFKYPYERKYSSNEQFWVTFPWQDFFPDNSLTVNNIPDISLTCFKFRDISRFSRQVVTLISAHFRPLLSLSMHLKPNRPTDSPLKVQHSAQVNYTPLSEILTKRLKPSDDLSSSLPPMLVQKSLARVLESTSNGMCESSGK